MNEKAGKVVQSDQRLGPQVNGEQRHVVICTHQLILPSNLADAKGYDVSPSRTSSSPV
jgi:hypothetical protein